MPEKDTTLIMLGEVKGKLDSAILMLSGLEKEIQDHRKRLNRLENSRAWLLGAAGTISFIVANGLKHLGFN